MEVKDFLDDTVNDILDRVDLPSPISSSYTLASGSSNADGSTNYALPSNFRRLQRDAFAVFETTAQRRPLTPVTDDGAWLNLTELGASGAERFYRLKGFAGNWSMDVFDAPGASSNIQVFYVTNNWMENSGGTDGSAFTNNEDVLLLPRRIVEAGIVWRFRERKGLPYVDMYNQYEAELSRLIGDRRAMRAVNFGDPVEKRKPWDVPVPDFIPSS
jgi:hypothetical protein